MRAPTLRDSRGNKSVSLFLVVCGFLVMVARVIAPFFTDAPHVSVVDFGIGVTGLIAAFQAREYKQKEIEARPNGYPESDQV